VQKTAIKCIIETCLNGASILFSLSCIFLALSGQFSVCFCTVLANLNTSTWWRLRPPLYQYLVTFICYVISGSRTCFGGKRSSAESTEGVGLGKECLCLNNLHSEKPSLQKIVDFLMSKTIFAVFGCRFILPSHRSFNCKSFFAILCGHDHQFTAQRTFPRATVRT